MINREIRYTPGFFNVVDEIQGNAADNKVLFSPFFSRSLVLIGSQD
jgi:hypothetical protein